jgi:mRNA interferase YafQ
MKVITRTSRFDKDVSKMKKRGKSFEVFKRIIEKLAKDELLEQKFRDHKLIGNYAGTRECHIEPDWLLIYINNPDELVLVRTGTHADLFR